MYCGYDCDTMVNKDEKIFFCAINYPGRWADGAITQKSHSSKRMWGLIRKWLIRDFQGEVTHIVYLFAPLIKRAHRTFIKQFEQR
jgi:hypothetical protein